MGELIIAKLYKFFSEESAATAVEYAVILALIIAVIISTIYAIGIQVNQSFDNFNTSFNSVKG